MIYFFLMLGNLVGTCCVSQGAQLCALWGPRGTPVGWGGERETQEGWGICILKADTLCWWCSCWVLSVSCDPMDCSPLGSSVHGDSLSKDTGMRCHFLLLIHFVVQQNLTQYCKVTMPPASPKKLLSLNHHIVVINEAWMGRLYPESELLTISFSDSLPRQCAWKPHLCFSELSNLPWRLRKP